MDLKHMLGIVVICTGLALPIFTARAGGEPAGECAGVQDLVDSQTCKLVNLLKQCAPTTAVSDGKSGLMVFAMQADSENEDVLHCLSSRVGTLKHIESFHSSVGHAAAFVPSPFDLEMDKARPFYDAAIRIGRTVFYVSTTNSDYGIRRLLPVAHDIFVISSANVTHKVNYLFFGDSGRTKYCLTSAPMGQTSGIA